MKYLANSRPRLRFIGNCCGTTNAKIVTQARQVCNGWKRRSKNNGNERSLKQHPSSNAEVGVVQNLSPVKSEM